MSTRIGFVGLGMMGLPMVENLARSGAFEIIAHDRSAEVLGRLAGLPGFGRTLTAATDPGALAACEIVITMLPNSAITSAVIAGDEGLAGILPPGAVIVDMGSSDPAETARLAAILSERGIGFADAPVSGAVVKAKSGQLAIMVGADDATLSRIDPVLKRMGSAIIHTGAVGSAHAMKALNNYVYAAGLLAVSEALLIAERMGLDAAIFADVLNASSGRNIASETKLRQFLIPRDFRGGFAMALQAKDIATAARMQTVAGVEARQLSLCDGLWREAVAASPTGTDNTAIYDFISRPIASH